MPKREEKARVHILLYEDDWQELETLFGKSVGRSAAIREIVHNAVALIKAKVQEQARSVEFKNDEFASLTAGLLPGGNQSRQPG
jgi:hypothetical protein